jgi:phage tail protein X
VRRWIGWTLLVLASLTVGRSSDAFPHIVGEGESVAQIAEMMYGRVELERVIVAVNALDARGGTVLVPGMRLEIPAVGYHQVSPGETWHSIAAELLGASKRGDVLANLNGAQPWLRPAAGREIVVPYNLRYVASRGDTTQALAYRYLGRRDEAWVVAAYNGLKRAQLRQGEVVLVPLTDLALTARGKSAALRAGALVRTQAGGQAREAQRFAEREIPSLTADVRGGRYVEAVRKGAGLLARGGLSQPQLAVVHRQLVEAYVALNAVGLAATSCAEWRQADPQATLDPIDLSPKIMGACTGTGARGGEPAAAGPDGGRAEP